MNKKLLLLIIIAVMAKLNVLAADGGKTSVRQENKVLVLSSYYQGYSWAGTLESSIVSHFSVDRKWSVEVDYLDLVANRDSSFMHNKAERLMAEHDANKKNIVVLLGEEAWIMYRTYMSEEWKNVPCVALFSGTYTISASDYSSCREITDDMKISLENSRKGINATLINDPYFVEPTIELALSLRPQTQHLALVSDTWQIGFMVREKTKRIVREKYPSLDLIDLNNRELTTAQLKTRLATLPKHTAVIFDSWFSQSKNTANRALYPDNAMRYIASSLTGDVVFGLYDVGIRDGVLAGGVYPTSEELQSKLIDVLMKIENGVQPKDMPLVKLDNANTYLNYQTLKKYGIPENLYPKNAIYFGKPISFFERNEKYILGGVCALIAIVILISVVAFFERKLKRQAKMLLLVSRENEKGKSNFITNMGYLMRSPLHAIQMSIDMLDKSNMNDNDKELLSFINQNKSMLLNIFNDIIDLGKAGENDLNLSLTSVDVEPAIMNIKEALGSVSGIQFTIEGDGKTHFVKVDPKRFSQVVSYAIVNADYYKMTGKVAVKFWGNQNEVVVQVGCIANFTEKDTEALFDVFNNRTNPANSGRSNLELPLCRKLMQAMGGNITLERLADDQWAFVIYIDEKICRV
ncbi:histidine kinase dimerization/phospho-acceptor domain-containing protein [Prevotella sp. P2-180]|uniref:sensor histidine kinase n=1 Tax=Prevotella sp. P2-180 TaxID=2024224 RepID=UPI00113FE6E9|nr:histidine kinase dimerization/phospho-acceptor domain-containing protein [Prevotella sp. P2-180]